MGKLKTFRTNLSNKFSAFIQKTFSDKKRTFKFLALFVFTILFLFQIAMILINNSFYNNGSDDVLQYYTIMVDFINGLKDGSISWFNLNNYFGASFFSDVYYIPIDIFTGATLFLSYLMPTGLAYSVTELLKILSGVMLFSYYLSLKGMKNRTIFWMGIIYFISGGSVSFMAFPVFLSLTAYMPLALIIIHYFFKKKRWIVPLFAMGAIFYDFYLGYTLLAFSCFAFLLEYFKMPKFKFFVFIKEIIIFVSLLLLGVVMAAVIAYPSIIFILEETYRNTGNFNAWNGLYDLLKLNVNEDLVFYIGNRSYGLLQLFQPNIYIRMVAKMFVEQKPIGFYGFENSYATEHFSLYISVIGFVYMNYVFFMKDKISRVYKVFIFLGIFMMVIPIFSYVFSGTLDAPYTRWINMLPIFQVMILAHVFDKYGFEKVRMAFITPIIIFFLALLSGLMYYYINQLKLDDYLASRDVLTADTVMFGVAGLFLLILLVFGWLKKWKVIKAFLWIEIFVALGYIYSGPLVITNKIDTFENANQIDKFLSQSIDEEDFYRVYIDIDNLSVEDTNFNRMTSYATNTGIFHSWTDQETNAISELLFNKEEYQSKNAMNTFGYYLNHFLSYKYVLVSSEVDYGFSESYFKLISSNDYYRLYEIENVSPFKVYESYLSYFDFRNYRSINSEMGNEKILLLQALINLETTAEDFANLEHGVITSSVTEETIPIYSSIYSVETVLRSGHADSEEREFFKYSNDDIDISFNNGSVYIKSTGLELEDYGEIFMEFSDKSTAACIVQDGYDHQIKCDFGSIPESIYLEKNENIVDPIILKLRQEAAINRAAYLVYDLSEFDVEDGIDAAKFSFSNSTYNLDKAFVVDEYGNEYNLIDGFYNIDTKPYKLYVYKTAQIYGMKTNIFSLTMKYSLDDMSDIDTITTNELIENEYLSIKNGKINISYTNISTSEYDQVVMIPVCYSDDWKIISDVQYDTLSISGGFLGVVVPNGTSEIDITFKFVPKGLDIGALITAGGILVYSAIFIPYVIKKRNKNGVDAK